MTRRSVAIILIAGLFLFLMVWTFGSSAANGSRKLGSRTGSAYPADEYQANQSATMFSEGDDEEEVDADLGKRAGRIDRETYLRLRDEYIARKRGIEPGRPFDPGARGRAIQQMERLEKGRLIESIVNGSLTPPVTTDAAWTPLGPSPLPNGVGTNPASGRVTSIAIDPRNSNTVYLGTAQGGVWRSTDGGTSWTPIFDSAQTLAVGALALAPSSPTTLYVGTGEPNRCGDCFFGAGLYRIDSADTTATLVGPINPAFSFTGSGGAVNTNVFTGRSISAVVVSPNDAATIFVGTSTGVGGSGANALAAIAGVPPNGLLGVYRSTNATASAASITFQKMAVATGDTTSPDIPATGNRRITDIIMEPGNPNNMMVGVFGNAIANDGGIFRTTNALASSPTFSQVFTISTTRIQFAIYKDTNITKVLAATSETPSPACSTASQEGVLRQSVDGGATWPSATATATTGGILTGAAGFCGTQCNYNVTVAMDPKNANTIYIGGNSNSTCSGLMKSATDGVTFARDSSGLHVDSHALVIDSSSTVFTGNDGGVWKRSAGAVGTPWTNLNSSPLNTLQFEGIAVHPSDRNLMIGGTQDNGTEFQQTSGGNWSNAEGGDGGYCLIDQSATDTTSVTMYHTFFNETGTQIGFDRITKTACLPIKNSWPTRGVGFGTGGDAEDPTIVPCDGTANYTHNGISLTDNVLFYAPMALGPGTPNTVYFGSDRLYRSTDRGDTMTVVSQAPISGTSPVSTIGISPQDDNYRILGLQNGQVWATSTGSSTLVNITSGSFPVNPNGSTTNKFVGRAVIDPNNKDVAYVAFSFFAPAGQGVWKITNLGAASGASPATPNWSAAGSGIPSVPINALAIDPANSNNIFAGTDIGVYNSTDAGATWVPFGTGLPRVAVFDMALQNANRILRVGTHGRGVWEILLGGAPPPPTPTPTPVTNPIDTADFFVRQQYSDFLNRPPDASGLAFWTNEITSCGSNAQCIDVKRVNTSGAFYLSTEFQNTGYLVYRIYKVAYGDISSSVPVPLRFNEFLPDTQTIGKGVVVGQTGWENILETNKQAYTAQFVASSRFASAFPTTMTPAQFVDKLFADAGFTPATADRTAAVNEFGSATTTADTAARSRALRDVAENSTLQQREFNKAFVVIQYFGYLRRNPNDPPEPTLDFAGYNFWLNKLNQFNGNFQNAEMVRSFIVSSEYRKRFGP